ncbi:MAG: hypothetical protein ACRETN_10630, partial [Nevskiales bacterium]
MAAATIVIPPESSWTYGDGIHYGETLDELIANINAGREAIFSDCIARFSSNTPYHCGKAIITGSSPDSSLHLKTVNGEPWLYHLHPTFFEQGRDGSGQDYSYTYPPVPPN